MRTRGYHVVDDNDRLPRRNGVRLHFKLVLHRGVSNHQAPRSQARRARTVPYSFSYVAQTHSPGSFPRLRTGTKAAPSLSAITGPNRKPRASSPTITSIFLLGEVGIVADTRRWVRWVITTSKVKGLRKRGKMSQKATP
jgi:hypothetical protein